MDKSRPSVHPELARHQDAMKPEIHTLKGHIHFAFGYSVVNCTLIEGDDACILIDTLTSMETAEIVAAELKKITEKPKLNYFVNAGLYLINPKVLKLIPKNKYFDITDPLPLGEVE